MTEARETWTAYRRWTTAELGVLRTLHDSLEPPHRPEHGYSDLLAPHLPGRSDQDIRNGFNVLRRKLARICNCGAHLEHPEQGRCPTCVRAAKEARDARLADALCAVCSEPLGPGSSVTHCTRCRAKRQAYRPAQAEKFKARHPPRPDNDPLACHRVLPWPACGHARWIAQLVAETHRPVIDLCGGVGEQLRLVATLGGHAEGYYDLDPRVTAVVAHAAKGHTLTPEASDLLWPKDISRATRTTRERRLRLLGQTLQTLQNIECADALEVLGRTHPKNTIFLADPPWPGSRHPATATIDHARLMDALLDLPYEQDFVLSLGSERLALTLAARHLGQGCALYWRSFGPFNAKSLVALSPRLAAHAESQNAHPGQPVGSFAKYGA